MDRSLASEEAQRWLGTAEKLLAARDLLGAKSFAIRVREAFPRLDSAADDVVAVADTLLAGEFRINGLHDWYAVLGLPRYTHNLELVASQYRRLALVLNPHRNRLPLASDAFRLVTEAWSVLSNPSKKLFYDNEFGMFARYDFASGSTATPQLQEHQFLQRNHHFFNQNHNQTNNQFHTPVPASAPPPPPPPPPQTQPMPAPQPQPQLHAQSQRSSLQFQQQEQPLRKSPRGKEGRAAVEEERPNLNNVAESSRSARTIDSAPAPAPAPAQYSAPAASPARHAAESTPPRREREAEGPSFWTACPYCLILYEYPKVYEECVLRCQNCKRAFHAAAVPSPPIRGEGETYFCCWGFFPLGFSGKSGGGGGAGSGWAPFSPMFACPIQDEGRKNDGGGKGKRKESGSGGGGGAGGGGGSPRFIYKDDDVFVDLSDDSNESDDDWRTTSRRSAKKSRTSKVKSSATKSAKTAVVPSTERVTRSSVSQTANNAGGGEKADGSTPAKVPSKGETSRKVKAIASGGKKKGAVEWGRLDLNVEFSNDVEEQPPTAASVAAGMNRANGAGNGGEEDNIEGIGFFEGLDEFLSSLPILNVVGEDKVKAT